MSTKRVSALLAGFAAAVSVMLAQPAMAAGGSLDPAFGTGGKVLTNPGVDSNGFQISGLTSDAALQGNGDIVVSGSYGLARYLPSGVLDMGFGHGGFAPTGLPNDPETGLTVQPDGKFVWAGVSVSNQTDVISVARFTTSGALDPTFGNGGLTLTTIPGSLILGADAVVVQPDGKILIGGEDLPSGGSYHGGGQLGLLARFNADGTPDSTFGSGGVVTAKVGNITSLGLDSAGNIFVLPAHAEFSPAGVLDAGVTPAPITVSSHGGPQTFLPSGQYIEATTIGAGRNQTDVQVKRFNADGSVDPTFASQPFTFTGQQPAGREGPSALAVEPGGKVVVAGSQNLGNEFVAVARLNADGTLDPTFGTGGVVTTTFQGTDGSANAVVVQPDGKIVTAGAAQTSTSGGGVYSIALARFLGQ